MGESWLPLCNRKRNLGDGQYNNIPAVPGWLIRGYTGHEHFEANGLIHMNGRMYDPILGRMLSPDNYVQSPTNSQSYNRYSYVMNNPLKYTDPSGEIWQIAVGVVAGAYLGGLAANDGKFNPRNWDYNSATTWQYMAMGALAVGYAGYQMMPSNAAMPKGMASLGGEESGIRFFDGLSSEGSYGAFSKPPGLPKIGYEWGTSWGSAGGSREVFLGYYQRYVGLGSYVKKMFDSDVGRAMVPDFLALGLGWNGIFGMGGGSSVEFRWVMHGPEASWRPMVTATQSIGVGFSVDATFNLETARYMGNVNMIKRTMMQTNTIGGDLPTLWASGGVAFGGKLGVTGYLTPVTDGSVIIGGEWNIGLGLPIGDVPVNAAAGLSNSWIVRDYY